MSEKKAKPEATEPTQFGDEEVTVIRELGWFIADNTNRERLRDRLVTEMKASEPASNAVFHLSTFFADVIRTKERETLITRNDENRFADADPNCPRNH